MSMLRFRGQPKREGRGDRQAVNATGPHTTSQPYKGSRFRERELLADKGSKIDAQARPALGLSFGRVSPAFIAIAESRGVSKERL
jgi:hypothetical protein